MTLSARARLSAFAESTEEIWAVCLKITHPALNPPIRAINVRTQGGEFPVPVTSVGEDYFPYPFRFVFPQADGESVPTAKIEIDNVDRRISAELRTLTMPRPRCTFYPILLATPDVIEAGPLTLVILSVTYDAETMVATLSGENYVNKRFPALRRTPSDSPGLF